MERTLRFKCVHLLFGCVGFESVSHFFGFFGMSVHFDDNFFENSFIFKDFTTFGGVGSQFVICNGFFAD